MSSGTRLTGQAGRDRAAALLENDDEAEVKHLSRLLKHPPPFAGKEVVVVTWRGGWLCICGRVCWSKQHCKSCGQWSPCRDWCFSGSGCHKVRCKFPHPQFFLPRQRPPVGPDEHTAADGEELLRLPPPGSVPAIELARRKQAAAAAAAAEAEKAAAAPAPAPAPAPAAAASAAASGASAGMWADLEARARAAMDSATAGSGASSSSTTPAPATPAADAAAQWQPAAAAATAALLPAAPGQGGEDAEVAEYLAMLGIA